MSKYCLDARNKWAILLALCVLFAIYTVDRALLGLLAIPIQEETGMSNVRFGMLSSAIFWTYALVAPFAGLAGDKPRDGLRTTVHADGFRVLKVKMAYYAIQNAVSVFNDGAATVYSVPAYDSPTFITDRRLLTLDESWEVRWLRGHEEAK